MIFQNFLYIPSITNQFQILFIGLENILEEIFILRLHSMTLKSVLLSNFLATDLPTLLVKYRPSLDY